MIVCRGGRSLAMEHRNFEQPPNILKFGLPQGESFFKIKSWF